METIRGKFSCTSVIEGPYGNQVSFWALYSNTPEDNSYAQATPSGQITMMVNNPAAKDFFTVGESYYLDFKKVN
jgi:hypothetical protein